MLAREDTLVQDGVLKDVAELLAVRTNTAAATELLGVIFDATPEQCAGEWQHVCAQLIERIYAEMRTGKSQFAVAQGLLETHPRSRSPFACETHVCGQRASAAVDQAFRDVLLRAADSSALAQYAPLLQSDGDSSRLRRILMDSDEFATTCRGGGGGRAGRPSCASAMLETATIYKEVLARPPDAAGHMHYARLLALGARTGAQLRRELEQSDEFRAGPGLSSKAVRSIERMRSHFIECGGAKSFMRGGAECEGDTPVPPQNFSHPYWRGRWCDRRGCDDDGRRKCGFWPTSLYQMVLASVWGDAPQEWIVRQDVQGGLRRGGRWAADPAG